MSNPSVLGLVAGELMDTWENVVWLHILTDTWELGLLVILRLLTLRSLQEWKNRACTIIIKKLCHKILTINSKYYFGAQLFNTYPRSFTTACPPSRAVSIESSLTITINCESVYIFNAKPIWLCFGIRLSGCNYLPFKLQYWYMQR